MQRVLESMPEIGGKAGYTESGALSDPASDKIFHQFYLLPPTPAGTHGEMLILILCCEKVNRGGKSRRSNFERLSEMLQISLLQQFCAIDTSWQQQCWSTRWCRLLLWGSCKSFSKSSWSSWSSYLATFSQLLFIKLKGVAQVFAYVYHSKRKNCILK